MNADAVSPPALDPDDCWRAVLARDPRADGTFVYAVRSTGIYCRPTCPSRRPGREHVAFFATVEEAARAGFRACRRCRPDQADRHAEIVGRVCRRIDDHPGEALDLAALAAMEGLSRAHLARLFKRVTGITPRAYAETRRLGRLKETLRGGGTVTAALYEAGYGSSRGLYERSDAHLGMTPAAFRAGGAGQSIAYRISACPLGLLLVAATENGLCAVTLGDDDATLEAALRRDYPRAALRRDDDGLGAWVDALLRHLDGALPHLDLPVDVRATAFQRRVWEALRAIPIGETRSYGAIAEALGQPRSARAVARACALNRVSLVVPCHRVVRGDGGLGGYRWGVDRKQALLDREAREKPGT